MWYSEALIQRYTEHLRPQDTDILTIGFARRFATYKRATLLFSDPERLARLVNDPERPVMIILAGKAHPHDLPAQELIRAIHDISRRPEFEGRLLLLEGYDLALARKLVTGVDVWLNTPEYPLEASGTSGEKAGHQRRRQPERARWLVGRGLQRRQRLGHHAARSTI